MKTILFILSILFIVSCTDITDPISNDKDLIITEESPELVDIRRRGMISNRCTGVTNTFELKAGSESNNVGTVSITGNSVTFTTIDGWRLSETHVHVVSNLNDIPTSSNGAPILGHFDYSSNHNGNVTTYTYDITIPNNSYVVAHADVWKPSVGSETAFAGNIEGGGSRWWWYMKKSVTGCFYGVG